eukprot:COSAG01_NODE_32816_length_574_cov_44.029474_1_plen_38_part_10
MRAGAERRKEGGWLGGLRRPEAFLFHFVRVCNRPVLFV